ncbi:MAG: hypothetical protein ACJ04Q_02485 [Flavobacteriales bacterium]
MDKKSSYLIILSIVISTLFNSCMTTKTSVGKFNEITGNEYTYSKSKQFWLFWGVIPLGRTNTNTPDDGNCEVITRFNFGDVLISGLTGGIVTSYTIKVKAKNKE